MPSHSVQYIGSRELHRDMPRVLDALGDSNARVVLTVHSKPRAVLIGAEAFLAMIQKSSPEDKLLALQLEALVQGLSLPSAIESTSSHDETSLPGRTP